MGAAAANGVGGGGSGGGGGKRGEGAVRATQRSGKGPVASAVLLALTLLTPAALLLVGLACGDPGSPIASRARAALGPAGAYPRLCEAVTSAAPDLVPASAALAAWAAEGAARARGVAGGLAGRAAAWRGSVGPQETTTQKKPKAPTCQLSGSVDAECCRCTYSDVQRLNERHVAPLVQEMVKTAFFRYFKVNIACDCPLWPDDSMCALKACSVCHCGDDEVPAPWLAAERASGGGGSEKQAQAQALPADAEAGCSGASDPACSTADCTLEASGRVDTRLDARVASRLRHVRGWRGVDNPWIFNATAARIAQRAAAGAGFFGGGGGGMGGKGKHAAHNVDDSDNDEEQYQYINLLANPERYTGYKGEHAHRIWAAIYGQSCFALSSPHGAGGGGGGGGAAPSLLRAELERCTERRVFYRLISGMHASISAHLVGDWLLDEAEGEWGPNMAEFRRRFVDEPEAGERVANLYFAYLFVLRAVTKAAPLLADPAQYDTGLPEEDARTRELVRGLLGDGGEAAALRGACPLPFDEGRLWRGEEGPALRRQLQSAFQNITRVMDCVGCEKCKLWGKLQTLGVATALKILFSEEDCEGNPGAPLRLAVGGPEGGADVGGVGGGGEDGAAVAAAVAGGGGAGAFGGASPLSSSEDEDYADGYDDEAEAAPKAGGDGSAPPPSPSSSSSALRPMTLERNEVIALVNLLGRFSNALRLYHELSRRVAEADGTADDAATVLA